MTLRSDLRSRVSQQLGDPTAAVFTSTELNLYFTNAVKSLYPTYWRYMASETVGSAGTFQAMPTHDSLGVLLALPCRNLYQIKYIKPGTVRPRLLRQWTEASGFAEIPRSDLLGDTIIWSWTTGFTDPGDDITTLDMNPECEEIVTIRMMIACLERVASNRVEAAKYFSLTVREGVTEQDVIAALDALHATLQDRLKAAVARPARIG